MSGYCLCLSFSKAELERMAWCYFLLGSSISEGRSKTKIKEVGKEAQLVGWFTTKYYSIQQCTILGKANHGLM
jgi:hypothetical protein